MPFASDGTFTGRPRSPDTSDPSSEDSKLFKSNFKRHHIIGVATLVKFWNTLVGMDDTETIACYFGLIGPQAQWKTPAMRALAECRVGDLDLQFRDPFEQAIAWQPYNLFEGPIDRPGHAPDPTEVAKHFKRAPDCDYPPVAPPNGERVNNLWRAYGFMHQVIAEKERAPGALYQCLLLLEAVSDEKMIRAHDVNWFAVAQPRFWAMSSQQRQHFFDACYAGGWGANGNEVYEKLFSKSKSG